MVRPSSRHQRRRITLFNCAPRVCLKFSARPTVRTGLNVGPFTRTRRRSAVQTARLNTAGSLARRGRRRVVNYRPLGKTEIEVSEIGFGTWTLTSGKWGAFPLEKAIELLRYAYSQGIVYFDTSGVNAGGLGEVLLDKAFSGQRELIVITTKVGYTAEGGRKDFPPDHLRRAVDA